MLTKEPSWPGSDVDPPFTDVGPELNGEEEEALVQVGVDRLERVVVGVEKDYVRSNPNRPDKHQNKTVSVVFNTAVKGAHLARLTLPWRA